MFGNLRPGRWRRSLPTGRITLAGVLVAAVVGVAFGTGYTTTKAIASDDSAWLQKGDTIVHVNGPSGRYDAVVADKPTPLASSVRDRLQIVEGPGSQLFAADPSSHKVYKIDLSTMAPQTLGTSGTSVLAAGSSHFVVNATKGTVTSFDPKTLDLSPSFAVPGGVASDAINSKGVAYIGSNDGTVTVLAHGKRTTTKVGPSGHPIDVSVVGNTPIAIDTSTGQLHDLGASDTAEHAVALPGQPKATVQVAPSLSGNTAWLVRGEQLVEVNPSTGYSVQATLPARHVVGAPLANDGKGYVPDDTADQVLVYDSSLGLVRHIPVPAGQAGAAGIQIVVKDGNVWADNPTSSEATIIHPNGTTQVVDKGTGNGVVVPGQGHKTAQPEPGKSAAAAPRPQPATSSEPPASTEPKTSEPQPTEPQPTEPKTIVGAPAVGVEPSVGLSTPPTPAEPSTEPVTTPPTFAQPLPQPTPPPAETVTAASPPPTVSTPPPLNPAATPTTQATTVVPSNLEGKTLAAACQAISAAHLVCAEKDLGQAPAGKTPNTVTAVPDEGKTVAWQTSVEVDFYGKGAPITIPSFAKGEDPQAYCAAVPTGLTCSTKDLGKGNPKGQVIKTEPPVGTSVAYGSTVLADYYSDSTPIFVPTPDAPLASGGNVPTDPKQYCTYADTLGFDCTATADATESDTNGVAGLADPSQALNTVEAANVDPAPSATVGQPYGTQLAVHYFDKKGVAVPDVANEAQADACTKITTAGFTCGTPSVTHVAGQTPGTVVAGTEQPAANTVVASGTTVTFAYDPGEPVPTLTLGEASTSACDTLAAVTPVALGCDVVTTTVAYGGSAGVTGWNPASGTTVASGATVTVDANVAAGSPVVADCTNTAPGQCATTGITYTATDDGPSIANCGVILSQSTAAGTSVNPGTVVTTHYNSCYTATVVLTECHDAIDNLGGEFHYLEAGTANPSAPIYGGDGAIQGDWACDGSSLGAYAVEANGACPIGTEPLYETSLGAPDADPNNQPNLSHYNVDPTVPFGDPWGGATVIACVLPFNATNPPAGQTPIYIHPIANPNGGSVVDWSWSADSANDSTGGAAQAGWNEIGV